MENDSVKERLERENRCWCELIPILAIRIRCICYHEILSENEIVSASGYLEILDNFVDVQRAHWLHIMCLFNANKQPHHSTSITAWTERNKIGQRFHTLYSLYLSAHDFHWLHSLEGATHHIAYSTVDSFEKKNHRQPIVTHTASAQLLWSFQNIASICEQYETVSVTFTKVPFVLSHIAYKLLKFFDPLNNTGQHKSYNTSVAMYNFT